MTWSLLSARSPAASLSPRTRMDAASDSRGVRHPNGFGELTRIYVMPAQHGKGIGFQLLSAGLVWLRKLAVATLVVAVERLNLIGRSFYERNGFSEQSAQTDEMFGHHLETVMYRREVG